MRGRLLDLVADRTRAAVDGWLGARSPEWLAAVATVALDPWRGYASALVAPLAHATVVVDHYHAVRLASIVVDQVRRRVQQATLGHRGRTHDLLYRWADSVGVAELSRLTRTVRAWEAELLAFHTTGGCSNGPTEAVNLLTGKVKRVGHGFRNFANYRLRLTDSKIDGEWQAAAPGGASAQPGHIGAVRVWA